MKILYIGCVKSSERFLKSILDNTNAEVVGIVTKVESNYNSDFVPLNEVAVQHGIDWINYKDHNQLIKWIQLKNPDIIYCFGWSYLLPKEVFTYPKLGALGYHPTLLPKNRGRHPIIWTIVLGLKETGSTFFYLTDTPDAGDIVSQEVIELEEFETATSLYDKLLNIGEKQVVQITNNLMYGKALRIAQDETKATYWRKRSKKDGVIDWRMDAKSIIRLINALSHPYVGAHFEYGDSDIIIWKAEIVDNLCNDRNIEPGKIVEANNNSFIVKTSDYLLNITDFEGKFIPKVGDYL